MTIDVAQQEFSNNKCYASAFRCIYRYRRGQVIREFSINRSNL